jgi:hypothetical protein
MVTLLLCTVKSCKSCPATEKSSIISLQKLVASSLSHSTPFWFKYLAPEYVMHVCSYRQSSGWKRRRKKENGEELDGFGGARARTCVE